MQNSDLLISNRNGVYQIKVSGRANFEYAVPLRNIAKGSGIIKGIVIDLGSCTAMDSTFMGVLSMIGLKARRCGATIEVVQASEFVRKLLRDLGIAKLFDFADELTNPPTEWTTAGGKADMLSTAETVTEAHEKLVEADQSNEAKFSQVIEFAKKDVERLKGDK